MAKQLRIDDPELTDKARTADVIIIGGRRFVLESDVSPAADTRPKLTGKDVDAYLAQRRRELDRDD